ncbi:MAG TPA: twin-arginine translocase subunit TatC [Flavobacteriaceae bacterium]|nr:twin-arginine translocase subunit TatC [Flavobacteriaceae bacterium]
MAEDKNSQDQKSEMSFLQHLEELRWHLIRSTLAILILATLAFIAKDFIFNTILFAPKEPEFITYRVFCNIVQSLGLDESVCVTDIDFRIQNRTMAGQFNIHIWTSITAGIILGFPYVLYELWKFISPALKESEKKNSQGFILIASILFFLGVLFGYYIIAPLSINFLANYRVSAEVFNDIDISSYMGLVRTAALASGIIFELPIIIFILTKIGLVSPEGLKKYRKFAIVGILVLAAIITPPDIVSQVIVAIPILVLYEISIIISRIVLKREKKRNKTTA